MVAIPSLMESLHSVDPATGEVLKTFAKTSPLAVPQLLAKTREAQ